jgi:pimeloyl-ACP methyl ester carboxylesterase
VLEGHPVPGYRARSVPRRLIALTTSVAVLVLLYSLVTGAATMDAQGIPVFANPPPRLGSCQPVRLPVTLPGGQDAWLAGHLCTPAHSHPRTVLMLAPGGTYNSAYWSWPVDPDFYSFTWQALADGGFAVFAVDRLGTGQSSHPPSTLDTFTAQGYTLHQAVARLRAGTVGHTRYQHVILIGHSFGSAEIAQELHDYPADADAVIFTGSGHAVSAETTGLTHTGFAPAVTLLPRDAGRDPGYVTSTTQQVRDQLLYRTVDSARAVRVFDQATRDLLAVREASTRPSDLSTLTAGLRIPTLLLDGQDDSHYCNGAQLVPETGLYDCATATDLYHSEQAHYGPCFAAAIVPGSGHDLTTEFGARTAATLILRYARTVLPPGATRARCTVTGPVSTGRGD